MGCGDMMGPGGMMGPRSNWSDLGVSALLPTGMATLLLADDVQIDLLPEYEKLGCQHVVLSFYQPPSIELLERCANLD